MFVKKTGRKLKDGSFNEIKFGMATKLGTILWIGDAKYLESNVSNLKGFIFGYI